MPQETSSATERASQEATLWAAYRSSGCNIATRNALAEFYRPLIESLAYRFVSRRNLPVTVGEVMGAVWERILCVAIPRYDRRRRLRFVTFARPHIRGAILDALRKDDWVPRSVRQQQTTVKRAIESLEHQHGLPPSDAQIARRMRISVAELQKILVKIRPVNVVSLNAKCRPQTAGGDSDSS